MKMDLPYDNAHDIPSFAVARFHMEENYNHKIF
jgi:hypothetical protein